MGTKEPSFRGRFQNIQQPPPFRPSSDSGPFFHLLIHSFFQQIFTKHPRVIQEVYKAGQETRLLSMLVLLCSGGER